MIATKVSTLGSFLPNGCDACISIFIPPCEIRCLLITRGMRYCNTALFFAGVLMTIFILSFIVRHSKYITTKATKTYTYIQSGPNNDVHRTMKGSKQGTLQNVLADWSFTKRIGQKKKKCSYLALRNTYPGLQKHQQSHWKRSSCVFCVMLFCFCANLTIPHKPLEH